MSVRPRRSVLAALACVALAAPAIPVLAASQSKIASGEARGALIVVTHGANILPLTGIRPTGGEPPVVARGAGGEVRVVGRVAPGG